jgi:Holliday junction resolvase RusA-like endonuclease
VTAQPDASGLRFVVHGTPAPQGSKRHVGRGILVESSKAVRPWREAVKTAALDALDALGGPGLYPRDIPVSVAMTFLVRRPAGHYGTGRNATRLKPSAPARPVTAPDLDKMIRSTLDALTDAGVWADDAQVALITAGKLYADAEHVGARIHVAGAAWAP